MVYWVKRNKKTQRTQQTQQTQQTQRTQQTKTRRIIINLTAKITLLSLILPLFSCEGEEGNRCRYHAGDSSNVVARFDLDREDGMLPFPSDLFTKRDEDTITGLRLNIGEENTPIIDDGMNFIIDSDELVNALNSLDGFSNYALILVGISGDMDISTLPESPADSVKEDSSVFLLNFNKGSTDFGRKISVDVQFQTGNMESGGEVRYLAVRPYLPLEPASEYVVVITRGVSDYNGLPLSPSDDFKIISDSVKIDKDNKSSEVLNELKDRMKPIFDFLQGSINPLCPSDIALAFTFTTQSIIEDMMAISNLIQDDALLSPPVPDFDPDNDGEINIYSPENFPGSNNLLLPDIAYIAKGTFESPDFRHEGVGFKFDHNGVPVINSFQPIYFIITLPKTDGPFPIVTFQHGFYGEKERVFQIADYLARRGIATIAIDAPEHGDRGSNPMAFLNIEDILMLRDNFRQAPVDQLRLAGLIKTLDDVDLLPIGAPDGKPDFDVEKTAYHGNSLGSFIGGTVLALNDDIGAALLNVGGGGFIDFYDKYIKMMLPPGVSFKGTQFMILIQTIMDRADPINYARYVISDPLRSVGIPRQVLMQNAFEDEVIPIEVAGNYGRALGIPLVRPFVREIEGVDVVDAPTYGSGMFQFSPAGHGFLLSHGGENSDISEAGRLQMTEFFDSFFKTGTATIIDPFK